MIMHRHTDQGRLTQWLGRRKISPPAPDVHARPRSVRQKQDAARPREPKAHAPRTDKEPTTVTAVQRVRNKKLNTDGTLIVHNNKLFCSICTIVVSKKSSTITQHLKTLRHIGRLQKLNRARVLDLSTGKFVIDYIKDHASQSGLTDIPLDVIKERLAVLMEWLSAGIPVESMTESISCRLEKGSNATLGGSRTILDLIPMALEYTKLQLKEWAAGGPIVVIFDGTTSVAETVAIILGRVVDNQLELRLVRLPMLEKALDGDTQAALLVSVLCTEYGIRLPDVMYAVHDRASTNYKSINVLKSLCQNLVSLGCLTHTIDHVGEHVQTPNLDKLYGALLLCFAQSVNAKKLYLASTTETWRQPNTTRFWSWFESKMAILRVYPKISVFLNAAEEKKMCPASVAHGKDAVAGPKGCLVKVELAALCDGLEPFVKAGYKLEGDSSMLVFETYNVMASLDSHVDNFRKGIHPNLTAVVREDLRGGADGVLSDESRAAVDVLLGIGRKAIEPAFEWYEAKFAENDLAEQLLTFKAARMCDPRQWCLVAIGDDGATDVLRELERVNGISETDVAKLELELPKYLAKAQSDPVEGYEVYLGNSESRRTKAKANAAWYAKHGDEFPTWLYAFRCCLLLVSSSCAAERVFSMLKATFASNQHNSLEDYRELSVMLQFNSGQDKNKR
jgi:hypothetical protein